MIVNRYADTSLSICWEMSTACRLFLNRGRISTRRLRKVSPLTVSQLIAAFWAHASKAYPSPGAAEGKRPAGELGNYFDVLRPLRRLYGPTPAAEFGPRALKVLREEMLKPRRATDPRTAAENRPHCRSA